MQFKNAIALTGGIATGKSTVCNFLKLHGFLIIDADSIAHKILDENSSKIGELFGLEYINQNTVDRKKLGALIFADKVAKEKLQNFIHPLIKEEIIKQAVIFEANNKPYIIDIPLFFETKNYDIKNSVVVYTPQHLQLKRLILRDNISQDVALQKISNQMNIEEKKSLAKYVIDNSGNLKHLQKEIDKFIKEVI